MSNVMVKFDLPAEHVKTVLDVLMLIRNNTANKKVRQVTSYLFTNINSDVWAKSFVTTVLISELIHRTGKSAIHEETSLAGYLAIKPKILRDKIPSICNIIAKKTCKVGNLNQPKRKITSSDITTKKPTRVKHLANIILDVLP